jgi:hypothetical protein
MITISLNCKGRKNERQQFRYVTDKIILPTVLSHSLEPEHILLAFRQIQHTE